MLVGLGETGGKVGVGTSGLLDCGVAAGVLRGDGNSGARLAFVLGELLELAFAELSFSEPAGVGETDALAFALAFEFTFAVTTPPNGIPCSLAPVGGAAGCTAWLFGSADKAGA